MEYHSRIPVLPAATYAGASEWFSVLAERGVIIHPDDDPADIQSISDGTQVFNDRECSELRQIIDLLFHELGDSTYDAAYTPFMNAAGFAP